MMFWHPGGDPNVPTELSSEAGALGILQSPTVFHRVAARLDWSLEQSDYLEALTLEAKQPSWSPTAGIYLTIEARAGSSEKARQLCSVASEEFCERCTELSLELEGLLWDLQMARAQGALERWKFENRALDEEALRGRATLLRSRLALTTAALQMRLKRIRSGEEPATVQLSDRTEELTKELQELQESLDTMWVEGVQDERSSDLKLEFHEQRKNLQQALLAEQSAALNRLESELANLQQEQIQVSETSVAQALRQLKELQAGMDALAEARELAMGEMSMFCLIARKATPGLLLPVPSGRLLPILLSAALALICVGISARQDRTEN